MSLVSGNVVGVWLSNVPLDGNEGANGDTLMQLELLERTIADYEWIEDGAPYREWLVPAQLVDGKASGLCVVEEEANAENLAELAARLDAFRKAYM
jgi:hypothetical protein